LEKFRVAIVFGTRPEAIKFAPVIREFKEQDNFEVTIINTGQHKELLQPLFADLGFSPDLEYDSMFPGSSLGESFSTSMKTLSTHFTGSKYDLVLVQGDTSTALAAALAAFYAGYKVGHVEAGLRSSNLASPYPEEANRQLISRISDLNFAPTFLSSQNLLAEGLSMGSIHVVGNTGIDNLFWEMRNQRGTSPFMSNNFKILVTLHRRENQNGPISELCEVLANFSKLNKCEIVLPLHKSPVVRDAIISKTRDLENFHTPEALGYADFLTAMASADLILTDSGGVQEEAPSLGKKVIVLRDTTERQEGVMAGTSMLLGTSPEALKDLLATAYANPGSALVDAKQNPYGDGSASVKIVAIIREFLTT
jgi:UDP-N-acetylglucosamine 2-epimerase (non-hydrolysing)